MVEPALPVMDGGVSRPVARRQRAGAGGKRWVGWIAVALVLVLWQGVGSSDLVSAELLPGPIAVAAAFWYRLLHGYRQTSLVVNHGCYRRPMSLVDLASQ
ncbi:MAG: hypothetical protein ACREFO_09325 [Acetobacteraceae bacterium]